MKWLALLSMAFGAALPVWAQETAPEVSQVPSVTADQTNGPPVTLAGDFLGPNYVNFFGFVNGIYDSGQTLLGSGNGNNGSFGVDVGGGAQISHRFDGGSLMLSYRGDYRKYTGDNYGNGQTQYLSLEYAKRLSQRWTMSLSETGGITLYGTSRIYSTYGDVAGVNTNPFSPSTRFSSTSAFFSYRASARLTYTAGVSYFINRYNYSGSIGSDGITATGSATYQFTNRTSASVTYSHDKYSYERDAGGANIDGLYVSSTHRFGRNLNVTGSAGVTHTDTSGTIRIPVELILGGQLVPGYVVGHYETTRNIPTFSGNISKGYREFTFSASAGRGVNPGNGTLLASTNTYFGFFASRSFSHSLSNIGASAYYSHLTSIANNVANSYQQNSISVSYSRVLLRHLSGSLSYSYFRYGTLLNQIGGTSDNRVTFGVSISSKTIPITLF